MVDAIGTTPMRLLRLCLVEDRTRPPRTLLPSYASLVAHVVPHVFLVTSVDKGWVEVLLPVRPNGTTGWVRAADVPLTPVDCRIEVSLSSRQLTVDERRDAPGTCGHRGRRNTHPAGGYYIR